jgi:RNA 3'-terminal phosphate cyclase (ATP)
LREAIDIDGSEGEGGGQILRSALSLSMVTGRPFRLSRARARRKRPGLMRQHLTAVRAAVELSDAQVEGDELGSTEVSFAPSSVRTGSYRFSIGTAGSTTLVCQTVLPPLLVRSEPSVLLFEGGTHNPLCPPYPFLERVFFPMLRRMGARLTSELERPGYYPAGGGRFCVRIEPCSALAPLTVHERGALLGLRAVAERSLLPQHVTQRELAVVAERLNLEKASCLDVATSSAGPGNVLYIEAEFERSSELVSAFGERGVAAELVAERAVEQMERYLAAGAPVGEHLADQLLIPLALAGEGSFRTLIPSRHTRTNAALIERFLPVRFTFEERPNEDCWDVHVRARAG